MDNTKINNKEILFILLKINILIKMSFSPTNTSLTNEDSVIISLGSFNNFQRHLQGIPSHKIKSHIYHKPTLNHKELPPPTISHTNGYTPSSSPKRFKVNLPKTFNWHTQPIGRLLSTPFNQKNCGCCWAISSALCMNDNLITQKIIKYNPHLSPTYLLSCWTNYVNLKCQGSSPAIALVHISKFGIEEKTQTYNYDWCLNNSLCNEKQADMNVEELNQLIPTCVPQTSKKYFVENIKHLVISDYPSNNSEELIHHIQYSKQIIYEKGPIIGGFHVYDNLLNGKFSSSSNPSNIYLDQVDYKTNTRQTINNFKLIGGHAVILVGWGTGKVKGNLLGQSFNPTKWYNVPYWIVKNSWGTKWCENGFVKVAMYPYNKYSQFEFATLQEIYSYNPYHDVAKNVDEPSGGKIVFDIVKETKMTKETFNYYTPKKRYPIYILIILFIILIVILITI